MAFGAGGATNLCQKWGESCETEEFTLCGRIIPLLSPTTDGNTNTLAVEKERKTVEPTRYDSSRLRGIWD